MQIAILGPGGVGQTLATKLVESGHDVMMGSRTWIDLMQALGSRYVNIKVVR